MLNRIRKYFSGTDTSKAVNDSDVSAFLSFLIESPEAAAYRDELLPRIESFKSRNSNRQAEELPGLYLYVEKYIFKSSTPDLNKFRKLVGKHFKLFIESHPDFQIIFLPHDQQVKVLSNQFLSGVCKSLEQFLGNSADTSWGILSRWLNQQSENTSGYQAVLSFTQVSVQGEATLEDYITLSQDFFTDIEKRFNTSFVLTHYNEAYEALALKFTNLDAFHELIKLFPNKTLDERKLNILSVQQIRELLLEKVKNLEKISSELLQKNEALNEQSKLLNLQNKQLQDAQSTIELKNKELSDYTLNLEDIVEKRTRELETTNEILKQYNKNLEEHTFAISHQLKAPVSRIMGLMNLLNNHEQEIQSGNVMQLMEESVHELNDVLADLVHALNIKKDASHIVLESCDLKEIVEKLVAEFVKAYKTQAKLSFSIDGLPTVIADRNYVTQALKHVLDNCFKFQQPEVELEISTEITSRYNFARVLIADNGMGFPLQQVREKLFNPFQKFNTHTPGKGLGLYFANQLISVLNGSVEIESSVGNGTRVAITLPIPE